MDDETSKWNCTYGFERAGINVYSNIPEDLTRKWTTRLAKADEETPFMEPDKDLVLVDLNKNYLDHLVREAFGHVIQHGPRELIATKQYTHHRLHSVVESYTGREGSNVVNLYARLKGVDSLAEKLPRIFAEKGSLVCSCLKGSNHVDVKDLLGFKLVGENPEMIDSIRKDVRGHPKIELIASKDHSNGYSSKHDVLIWKGNTIPPGMIFEVHYETEEEYRDNINGTNGARSHEDYNDAKLNFEHKQGNNQIVILSKVNDEPKELEPIKISNDFVEYTLVHY